MKATRDRMTDLLREDDALDERLLARN